MENRKELTIAEFKELNFQITPQMKYRNKITEIDGIKFRSAKEAKYYGKLKMLLGKGDLLDFKMQVKYKLEVNGIKITTYTADFVETWSKSGVKVVDVKGMRLPLYLIKKQLMLAVHGITIKEV